MSRTRLFASVIASIGPTACVRAQAHPNLTAADYAAATALLEGNLRGTVMNQSLARSNPSGGAGDGYTIRRTWITSLSAC
jgi:hypothetical protein